MRIIDCFTFFNELDLLEFRLNCLYSHVEKFIIVEADITFSGVRKPFFFEENKKRFEKYLDKVEYIKYRPDTNGLVFTKPIKFDSSSAPWKVETGQRNSLGSVINSYSDEVVAIVCDIDEIWDPYSLYAASQSNPDAINGAYIEMELFYYFFNCKGFGERNRLWRHAYLTRPSFFKRKHFFSGVPTPSGTRGTKKIFKHRLPGGWHFSYLGGVKRIIEKIESFSHQELNTELIKDHERILKCVDLGLDPFARAGHEWAFVPMRIHPEWIREKMLKLDGYYRASLV